MLHSAELGKVVELGLPKIKIVCIHKSPVSEGSPYEYLVYISKTVLNKLEIEARSLSCWESASIRFMFAWGFDLAALLMKFEVSESPKALQLLALASPPDLQRVRALHIAPSVR